MSYNKEIQVPLHMPNIINICIDKNIDGDMVGRIYHCYDVKPWPFSNVVRMVALMEELFDRISFPQASTESRTFENVTHGNRGKLKKVAAPEDIAAHQGIKGTFMVCVKYRQNSTWQGEVQWIEGGKTQKFISVLELLKILNNSLKQ